MKKKLFSLVMMTLIVADLGLTKVMATDSGDTEGKQYTKSAFIATQDDRVLKKLGKYDDRHAPYSTFKVALALMGFDAGILETKDSPKWPFKEEYEKNFQDWYTRAKGLEYGWCEDHTPATFMKKSVVWFSHQITQHLGAKKFQEYVSTLNYGNGDVSGTPSKDDSLLNSWLGTSLEISPREQMEFLEKLCANALDVFKEAQEKTKEIMDREESWFGWKLYGKTGGGSGDNGWFIGWVEKDKQRIIFAQYLDLTDPNLDLTDLPIQKSIGLKAKEVAKANLLEWLQK